MRYCNVPSARGADENDMSLSFNRRSRRSWGSWVRVRTQDGGVAVRWACARSSAAACASASASSRARWWLAHRVVLLAGGVAQFVLRLGGRLPHLGAGLGLCLRFARDLLALRGAARLRLLLGSLLLNLRGDLAGLLASLAALALSFVALGGEP